MQYMYMGAYLGVGTCPGYYGNIIIIIIIIIMLFQNFGIDWDGPVPLSADSDDDGVVVPETICPLNDIVNWLNSNHFALSLAF